MNSVDKRKELEEILRNSERKQSTHDRTIPGASTESRKSKSMPMAIVGISGRYPKSKTIDDFWANLINRRNCIEEISGERLEDYVSSGGSLEEEGALKIKHFGLIEDIYRFEAPFFKISRREAEVMDPHMRLMLETVWSCIENAGYRPRSINPRTGVFASFYNYEYAEMLRELQIDGSSEAYLGTATTGAIFANRISFLLGLTGPSEVYNTACSTAIVACHRAVQAIEAGDCDQAIVAGVSLLLTASRVIALSRMGILNEVGVCNSFSHPANKEVIGEGVGAIMIKPLDRAVAEGDFVYAVIQGSDVNHHGDRSGSMTLPSSESLSELMATTYRKLGIKPEKIRFIEGHGAGGETDVIELQAIQLFLERAGHKERKIPVSSVKSNIGFGEASGGMAQLTKAALALSHGEIPATLNFQRTDPVFDIKRSLLEIHSENISFSSSPDGDCVSVLAYGLGGTNAHVVLSGYANRWVSSQAGSQHVFPMLFSAGSEPALAEYIAAIAAHLRVESTLSRYRSIFHAEPALLHALSRTLAGRERQMICRVVFEVKTIDEFLDCCSGFLAGKASGRIISTREIVGNGKNGSERDFAKRWTGGETVSFESWFNFGKYQKLPLPTVPFKGDVYRLKQKQRTNRSKQLGIEERWIVTRQETGVVVDVPLGPNDCFMSQHLVDGVSIMPGTGYIALLGEIAREVYSLDCSTIKNLAWTHPFETSGDGATMRFEFEESGRFRISHKESETVCCTGKLLLDRTPTVSEFETSFNASSLDGVTAIADKTAYWTLANAPETRQVHGPDLRRLSALYYLGDRIVGVLDAMDVETVLSEIAFYDSALGACRGFAFLDKDKALAVIPFAVEQVHLLKSIPATRKIYVSVKRRPGNLTRYDISIENGKGEIYAVLIGYHPKAYSGLPRTEDSISAQIPAMSDSGRVKEFLKIEMQRRIAEFLKCEVSAVPLDESLEPLGLDSIGINALTDQIGRSLKFDMPATTLFEYTNIRDVVDYLISEFGPEMRAYVEGNAPSGIETKEVKVLPKPASIDSAITRRVPLSKETDIAVVGMGGMFPGADNFHDFWNKIRTGQDLIVEIPEPRRKSVYRVYEKLVRDMGGIYGGFVNDADKFDAAFFGYSEEEVMAMDPQQRLFLEAAWSAIEDAGYYPLSLSGQRIGVYVGAIVNDYGAYLHDVDYPVSMFYEGTGSSLAGIANRVSYVLNSTGPSQGVDTACCSSLYAIDRAVIDIRQAACDAAIAGGVSFVCTESGYKMYSAMDYLSKDWRCKPFAEGGDGWSKAELFGAVFLKRLEDAVRDGDPIYAVIKASGTNHGGKGYFYTQPNGSRHVELIRDVYRKANVDPRSIVHIEAHGSGTEMGDALEFNSISKALKEFAQEKGVTLPLNSCGVGSIKSNIGHAEAGAGIAGFMKTVMLLHEKCIPPSLHLETINKNIRWKQSPLYLVQSERSLAGRNGSSEPAPRCAGVHSFNFSGAAAHVLVEEHIGNVENQSLRLTRYPICLSAKTPEALVAYCESMGRHLISTPRPEISLDRLVYTINSSRSHFDFRFGIVVESIEELAARMLKAAAKSKSSTEPFDVVERRSNRAIEYPELCDANVDVLLNCWRKESAFDWSVVLKGFSVQKLNLPTYPFEHLRSYFPQADGLPVPKVETNAEKRNRTEVLSPTTPHVLEHLGSIEQRLAQILATVLSMSVSEIEMERSISEYGFDSLKVVALSRALNDQFGLTTNPPDLFEFATLAEMVAFIEATKKDSNGLQSPLEKPRIPAGTDVAIIGMSGQMPGASNLEEFWKNLQEGKNAITVIPVDRWDWKSIEGDPHREHNKTNIRWGGFIDDVTTFDPLFFGISPREAELMDPQQRLLMMYVWRAIEDAGYAPSSFAGTDTGLFIATGSSNYSSRGAANDGGIEGFTSTGAIPSLGPNRMSHFLDLNGPSEPVETSCSSSLVAIHRAVSSISSGECAVAIAGGINTIVTADEHISFSKAGMLSRDGQCKTFSAEANGYVRGEGVGMLVLKPLESAEKDGDHIYGVIRSTAVNHGGRSNSLTAPNPKAQAELLKAAYSKARVDPRTVGYIETHGTGTPLGDPIEINALKMAFKALYEASDNSVISEPHCGLGAVKTNIGHLELAAGVAGVIKALLQLQHKTLVANLHCEKVNPYIDLKGSPFYLLSERRPWLSPLDPSGHILPRRAGISSFGFGGVNAHVVIEEYLPSQKRELGRSPFDGPQLILLSAKSEYSLLDVAKNLERFLAANPDISFADLAFTLQTGREAMEQRLALVADSIDQLKGMLRSELERQVNGQGFYRGRVSRNGRNSNKLFVEPDHKIVRWATVAEHWIRGGTLDWTRFYRQAKPKRISLPTYPFVRDRCWLEVTPIITKSAPTAESVESIFLPDWTESEAPAPPGVIRNTGTVLIVEAENSIDLGAALHIYASNHFPAAKVVTVKIGDLTRNIAADEWLCGRDEVDAFRGCLIKSESVSSLFFVSGVDSVESDRACGEELQLLRLAKLLREKMTASDSVDCFVLSVDNFGIGGTATNPKGGGLTGLAYAIAQGDHRFRVRNLDLSLDDLQDSARADALIAKIIAEPPSNRGEVFKLQCDHRYRRTLSPFDWSNGDEGGGFRENGVYVILGGSGEVGSIVTQRLIHEFHATVVWIGRTSHQDANLRAKIDLFRAPTGRLLYVQADARSEDSLRNAIHEVKKTCGSIHGALFAGAVFSFDNSIAECSESEFVEILDIKTRGSVNFYETFKNEALDFMCFFSSAQSFSFSGAANLSAYATGITFTDSFVRSLIPSSAFPVGCVNWGFWESKREAPSAVRNFGVLDQGTAFQCLERFVTLLRKRLVHQVVCLNASEAVRGMMPLGPDYVVLAHGVTGRTPGVVRTTESSKKHPVPDIVGGNEFDVWMLKLLCAQIRELDHLEGGGSVAPGFEKWLRESRRLLEQNQFEDPSAGNSLDVWAAWEIAKADLNQHAHLKSQIELVEICLRKLPEILRGTVRPTDILFPSGSMERVERIYKGSGQFDFFSEIVADSVHSYIEQRLALNSNYQFRILEIGAGTGGTTAKILDRLRSFTSNVQEYCYTDISQSFLLHGEGEFGSRGPFLRFKCLNIEQAPNSYGIDLGSYDLVIAANVLHATRDIQRTLRHTKSLLKRNGQLILDEIAGPSIFAHLTFGLLPGWWLFEDAHLRISGSPGLYPKTWAGLLRDEGFLSVSFPAEEAHFLSQQVVIAESDGLIRLQKVIERVAASMETASAPRKAALPVKEISDFDEAIKRLILQILSKLLKIPETQFELDVPFSEYGVDSILGVSFVNRLSDELGVSLNSAILFDYTTIARLAVYIGESLDQCAIKTAKSSVASNEKADKPDAALRLIRKDPSSNFDEIAVIGMSGQFPGANDVDTFWQNLVDGKDGVREMPAHYFDHGIGKKSDCTRGGILEDRACFDPHFFKITPREAESMNPHQRLILQESWKALEDAGIRPGGLEGKPVGLFIGAEPSGYEYESFTGASDAIIASRLSYFLNLKGPALVVNTGCSSSAAAIHLACQSLRNGESSMALAGGVFATMHQKMLTRLSSMDMLSPSGCCHSFDAAADGTVFSEGVGVVVLKRYQEAVDDGDLIYGVIQASGMNQDGASNGITAPNGEAQKALICDLYRRFKINPELISYVEAHGTGTKLGDPVEANALVRAFREFTSKKHFCAIGSVKSSIGHASAAAGVISLIKVLLMMRHEKMPETVRFHSLNPLIEFDHSAFFVNTKLKEWRADQRHARVAALNSFGHSGTNVHLVIRSQDAPVPFRTENSPCLILLSARDEERLKETVGRLISFLDKNPSADLASIGYTLQIGRDAMKERVGFVAGSLFDLRAKLEAWLADIPVDGSFRGTIDSQDRVAQLFKADEDSHAMLTRWLERRKLDKLAELWTLGVTIDWILLYPDVKPPKVRLPGYPFAKEQYWASEGVSQSVLPVKTSSVVHENSEVLCFEEVWDRQLMAPLTDVPINGRALTCICLLSDPGNQAAMREAMRESNPNLRIFFLSREEIGLPGFKRVQEEAGTVDAVLYLCPLENHALIRDLGPAVSMIQAIESSGSKPKYLILAGEFKDRVERCYLDSWIGFERSLPPVMAGTSAMVLLAEGEATDSDQFRNWSNRICQTLALDRPRSTLYMGGFAYALTVHPLALAGFESVNLEGKSVLITGGCGGLGLAVAKHLAARSKINFVLTGRSRLDERIESNLESLRALRSTACYVSADVSDLGAMERGLNRVRELLGAIHVVIHAAGIKDERTIFERENSEIETVLAPKINGTLVLDHLLAKEPLELVCYFSSSAAVLGDFGACDYAIGNRFQIAYSEYRNTLVAEGKLAGRTHVICWPLWDGIGMGRETNESTSFLLKSSGQRPLGKDEGLSLFDRLLSEEKRQHLVLAGNAEQLQRLLRFEFEKAKEPDSVSKEVTTEDLLRTDLREKLSSQFKLSPDKLVERQNFADFGVDSVGLADFARTLAVYYGLEFTPSDFFGHSTLESLRGFFMSRHAAHIERFYRTNSEIKNAPKASTQLTPLAIESLPSSSPEPVAIIGMSGRFPDARNVEEMWQILAEGRTAVRGIPADRFDLCRSGEQSAPPEPGTNPIWCGMLPGAAEFDPLFFEISPLEAESMDPRQRLLLQESWKALEDAAFGPAHLSRQKIGMFVGVEEGDYQYRLNEGNITSNHTGILAARLAYFLDLKGPVMAINTSCSSSLVAAHQACQSLRNHECDAAIAAGVSLTLSAETYAAMKEAGMLAPNGKCCAFDKQAGGMVPGEAVVAIVLKRLCQAVKDNDPIRAVIVGSGVNYDGKTNGITAPSGVAQSQLLKNVYENHQVNPREVEYVVTHGTGTRLGDPVEINALAEVFGQYSETGMQCALTSCKPNFGHTFAASGLVNLMSLVQSLKHEIIPASINCEDRNDYIRWDDRLFDVNRKNRSWPMRPERPRIGAISAFGMSGTNAHMIVRDHLDPKAATTEGPGPFLIVLSARAEEALSEQIQQLILNLKGRSADESDLLNVSYTLLAGRHHFSHRCAVVAADIQELIEALNARQGAIYSSGIVGARFTPNKKSQNELDELISSCGNSTKKYHDRPALLGSIARYYCDGYDPDWSKLFGGMKISRVHLPSYPFSRNRYWVPLPGPVSRGVQDSQISCIGELKSTLRLPAFEGTAIQSLLASQNTVMDRPMIELLSATLASLDLLQEGSKNLKDIASGRPAAQYLERWLKAGRILLQESQIPEGVSENVAELWKKWHRMLAKEVLDHHLKARFALAEVCLRALPEILKGERRPVDVIFPNSSMALLEPIYRHDRIADLFNEGVADCVAAYFKQRLAHDPSARIRILEIGAGMGATTSAVLPRLNPFKGNLAEYCYTDLSKAFLIHAEERFVPDYPCVVPKIFDVTKSIVDQNIEGHMYDLVIAANVLHATPDIRLAVRNAKAALRKHGVLMLYEFSDGGLFPHLAFGLLEGWWLYQDEELRIPGCPGLFPETWRRVLEEEGFGPIIFPAAKGHGLGQQLIMAESDGIVRSEVVERKREIQTVGSLPDTKQTLQPNDSDLRKRSLSYFKKLMEAALKMGAQEIDPDEPLESYGMDSLMIGKVLNKLREEFKEVPSTLLFEIQTVSALSDHFITNRRSEMLDRLGMKSSEDFRTNSTPRKDVALPNIVSTPLAEARPQDEQIAIIGLSGHYPSAPNLQTFWENIKSGKDCITEIPPERWSLDGFFNPNKEEAIDSGMSYCKWGAFLEGFNLFDPLFFNIAPREALHMDPQERLFLQAAWEVLEDAGYTRSSLSERFDRKVGVFTGITHTDYNIYGPDQWRKGNWIYPRTSFASVPNRVSFLFNLEGPSMPVDTMCSSSLTAIHEACESIKRGECVMAIAGAVNLCLHPSSYVGLSAARMLSTGPKCHSFGAGDDGFVSGEGVGAVLLKRLSDAIRDKDQIYAVIRGTAVNHGGRTNGYTVPNPQAQGKVVREALNRAGIDARTVTCIEAHGTGTKLGDPIEVAGLTRAFQHDTQDTGFCSLGSVKSNVGHLEAAAGLAGLTKVILQMKHGQLAPSLHSEQLNPEIDFPKTPFIVQQKISGWKRPEMMVDGRLTTFPRIAGISSFGAGGANAHVIVEEFQQDRPDGGPTTDPCLVVLSARNEARLYEQASQLLEFIASNQHLNLADITFTLQVGREAMEERIGLLANSITEVEQSLRAFLDGKNSIPRFYRREASTKKNGTATFLDDREVRLMTDKWLAGKKFGKLLDLWVHGYMVDWNLLYQAGKPNRISLPTYPFAKEVYWLSDSGQTQRPENLKESIRTEPSVETAWLFAREEWRTKPIPNDLDWKAQLKRFQGKKISIVSVNSDEALALMELIRQLAMAANLQSPLEINTLVPDEALDTEKASDVILFIGPQYRKSTTLEPFEDDISLVYQLSQKLMNAFWDEPIQIYYLYESDSSSPRLDCQALSGFIRAAMRENEQHIWTLIQHTGSKAARLQALVKEWLSASLFSEKPPRDIEIRLEGEARHVKALVETSLKAVNATPFKPGGVYLFAGGMGYLGKELSDQLAIRYRATLVIFSQGTLDEARQAQCRKLEALGAKVIYESVDITDRTKLTDAYRKTREQVGFFNGVFHLARRHEDQMIAKKPWSSFWRVIQPKVQGALLLDELTKDEPLDFFVLFSSLGAYGVRGSCDYSYSTAFQNAFSAFRNREVKTGKRFGSTVAMCWGPWMEDRLFPESRAKLTKGGFGLIDMKAGFATIEQGICAGISPLSMTLVRDGERVRRLFGINHSNGKTTRSNGFKDLEPLLKEWEYRKSRGEDISEAIAERITAAEADNLEESHVLRVSQLLFGDNGRKGSIAPPALELVPGRLKHDQVDEIATIIRDHVIKVLSLDGIDDDRAFQDYGLDSISGMQLAVRLEKQLKREVLPQWFINFPTVTSLSQRIMEDHLSNLRN
jgi:acyl transferase domain-containing protein/acyl carrier protein/NAD(P)-dependent dehydrogenase (short-subunit alcohol dehydrogenase family)/SAM-dependent methyltransferase